MRQFLINTSFLLLTLTIAVQNIAQAGQSVPIAEEFFSKLSDEFNLKPLLHENSWPTDGASLDNDDFVSREEANRYLSLLKFINPRRSPLVQQFQKIASADPAGGPLNPEMKLAEKLSGLFSGDLTVLSELVDKLKVLLREDGTDQENKIKREKLKSIIQLMKDYSTNRRSASYSDYEINPMAGEPNRELCMFEYGMFVEPVTDGIYNVVREIICNIVGNFLCNQIIPPLEEEKESPPWGARMFDAMSKIPHSIRDGQKTWVGAFDYCIFTEANYNRTNGSTYIEGEFTGKYCRLDLVPNAPENVTYGSDYKLQIGVCVPDTCRHKDVVYYITQQNNVLRIILALLDVTLPFAYCGVEDVDQWTDSAYLANFCICAIFLGIILLATIYDGFLRKHRMSKKITSLSNDLDKAEVDRDEKGGNEDSKKKCLKRVTLRMRLEILFVAFSAYSNMRRIFTTHRKPGDLPILNGIRVLTFFWVIWGQTFLYGPIYFESWVTANILYALRHLPTQFIYQAVINFHLTEDSFLLISGILLSYWYLKKHENVKLTCSRLTINAIYSLVHRYWRLVPTMMMCLMIFTTTYKFFSDGPLYPHEDTDGENCRITWWVPLTMTHNLVMTSQQCFGHAWFVPVIFQLHLAALLVLIPLVIKPVLGYIMLALMYIAHIGATAGLSYSLREEGNGSWYDDYFVTPWCRAGPFIIGMAYGIVFYHKSKKGVVKINKISNLLLWLLALFTVGAVSCWSLEQYKDLPDELHRWSTSALIAYDTLARSAWGLAVGWIAFACHFQHGGVLESLLTWSAWAPVSRLVYPAMLMHGMMIFNLVYTTRHAIVVEGYHSSYATLAHIIVCTLTGLVMSLVWDYPLSAGFHRVVMCPDRIAYIRSGRHSRKRLQELIDEFFPEENAADNKSDTQPPLFILSGNHQPIPNCSYVRPSEKDLAQLGFVAVITDQSIDKNIGNASDRGSLSSAGSRDKRRGSISSDGSDKEKEAKL